jgi:hypothetical protein
MKQITKEEAIKYLAIEYIDKREPDSKGLKRLDDGLLKAYMEELTRGLQRQEQFIIPDDPPNELRLERGRSMGSA